MTLCPCPISQTLVNADHIYTLYNKCIINYTFIYKAGLYTFFPSPVTPSPAP